MKKTTLVALALFLMSAFGTVIAEDVILVSDINYADSMIAGAVAEKIGASVFVVERDSIPSEIMSEIEAIGPEEIYIFGGPAVISESVENFLDDYNVTRISGMTRIGTSVQVARFFWPEGIEPIIALDTVGNPEDGNPCLAMLAKNLAASEGKPLLFVSGEEVPSEVSDFLGELNITKAAFMGVSSQARTRLQNMLDTLESFEGDCPQIHEQVHERAREKIQEKWGNNTPLVVVAAGNWTDYAGAPSVPTGRAILVWSADEISDAVEKVKQEDYSRLFVLGKPDLALQIADALEAEGITVDMVSGKPSEVSMEIRNKLNQTIQEVRQNWEELREQWRESIRDRWDLIVEKCNQTIHQIKAIRSIAPEVTESTITDAVNAYNSGNYERALKECNKLIQMKNRLMWTYRNEIGKTVDELVSEEKGSLDPSNVETGLSNLYSSLTNAPSLISVSRMNPSAISGKSSDCINAIREAKRLYQNNRFALAREAYQAAQILCR